jgi:hypothetical protein
LELWRLSGGSVAAVFGEGARFCLKKIECLRCLPPLNLIAANYTHTIAMAVWKRDKVSSISVYVDSGKD